MEGGIKKSLLERQDIFHHVAIGLCFLVTIGIVPTKLPKSDIERLLHCRELPWGEEVRYWDDTVLLKSGDHRLYHRGVHRAPVRRQGWGRVGYGIVGHYLFR